MFVNRKVLAAGAAAAAPGAKRSATAVAASAPAAKRSAIAVALGKREDVLERCNVQDGELLYYASDALKKDEEFIIAFLERQYRKIYFFDTKKADFINAIIGFKHVAELLRKDKPFVLKVISLFPNAVGEIFENIGFDLKCNRAFNRSLVEQNVKVLEHVLPKFTNDRNFMLVACSKPIGEKLYYASDALKKDEEFIKQFFEVQHCNMAGFKHVAMSLRANKCFALDMIESCNAGEIYTHLSPSLQTDTDVIYKAWSSFKTNIYVMAPFLRQDANKRENLRRKNDSKLNKELSSIFKQPQLTVMHNVEKNKY